MQFPSYKLSFKNHFRTMASLTVYRTGRQQCPGGFSRGEEIRDFYLIHYVMHGRGVYTLNGTHFPVGPGQAFLIYPHMPINYIADPNDPWEYCWVGFNGADAGLLMDASRFTPQQPVLTLHEPDGFRDLLLAIYQMRGSLPHEILRMTSGLYQVTAYLVSERADNAPERNSPSIGHLQRACDYIAEHYRDALTVEDLAAQLGLCRSQLYRIFKQHTGLSPQRYLMEFRIRQACNLLANEHLPVKVAALSVGFNDPLYFSTVFRQFIGTSPKDYLEDHRGKETK